MSENPNNPQPQFNQDPQFSQQAPQYGQPVLTPEQQAQVKRAKILSILAIVFGAIGLVLLSPLFSALVWLLVWRLCVSLSCSPVVWH